MSLKCNNCQQIIEVSPGTPIYFCPYCGEKNIFEHSSNTANDKNKSICPVCSTEIEPTDEKVICPDCKIAYHKDCWDENNGCATYGCKSTGILKPPPIKIEIPQAKQGNIICPYCHTNLPYGCEICWSCNKKISDQNITNNFTIAGPWLRYGARHVDLFLESILSIIIIILIYNIISNTSPFTTFQNFDILLSIIPLIPFILIVDIIIYMLLGNSIGKWLFNIKVTHLSGVRLNSWEYFKRNLYVFFYGLALLIPLVNLSSSLIQYQYINKNQKSKYDEKLNYMVISYENNKWWKKIIGVILSSICIIWFYSYVILIPIFIIDVFTQ